MIGTRLKLIDNSSLAFKADFKNSTVSFAELKNETRGIDFWKACGVKWANISTREMIESDRLVHLTGSEPIATNISTTALATVTMLQ